MKKLLALLVALLLLGCGAALAEEAVNPFLGQWEGVSASLMGLEFTLDELGWSGFTLHVGQDETRLTLDGETGSCRTVLEGDTLVLENGISCRLEDGFVFMTMISEGIRVTVKMERVGEVSADVQPTEDLQAASDANPFLGEWEGKSLSLMGMEFAIEEVGWSVFELRVEQDVAYLNLDGEGGECPTLYEGDSLIFTNNSKTLTCAIVDGSMYMTMDMEGVEVIIRLERVGGAPAAAVADAPVTVENFDGLWTLTAVQQGGAEMDAAQLGMSGLVNVMGQSARYTLNEESSLAIAEQGEGVLTLTTRQGEIAFTVDVKGRLCRDTLMNGDTVVLIFVREDAPETTAPAAETIPAAQTAASVCEFCGKEYEGQGHDVGGLIVCPTCYTRFFE